MTEPIKCFYFDHAYDQQASGPCCFLEIRGVKNFKELHQHPTYIEIKQNFEQGKWTDGYCDKCKIVEETNDNANLSKRQAASGMYKKYAITASDSYKLYDLTFDTGRSCNIQCRSCHPFASSSWLPEIRHMMEHNTAKVNDSRDPWFNKSELKNIKVWQSTNYYDQTDDFSNVKEVSLIGGEPLYNQETLVGFLQKILDTAGNNCSIAINTNATVSYNSVKILKEFKKITLILSIDAVGRAAEFIRTGCNWEKVNTNIIEYSQNSNTYLFYHPAYSVLNLFEFVKLREWANHLKIQETSESTVVVTPRYLNYCILNDAEKASVLEYLKENNLNFICGLIENSVYNETERKNFFDYMEHTKLYHDMDWREYLPELYALMGDS